MFHNIRLKTLGSDKGKLIWPNYKLCVVKITPECLQSILGLPVGALRAANLSLEAQPN
jgi:hypothetical protein